MNRKMKIVKIGNYSNKRHRLLVKYRSLLKKQDKSLCEKDLALCSELLDYEILVQTFIVWNMRVKFWVLLQEIENNIINCEEFVEKIQQFWEIYRKEIDSYRIDPKKLKTFHPNENMVDLKNVINRIFRLSDEFTPDWVFDKYSDIERDDTDTTEEELREAVRNILPKVTATIKSMNNTQY